VPGAVRYPHNEQPPAAIASCVAGRKARGSAA